MIEREDPLWAQVKFALRQSQNRQTSCVHHCWESDGLSRWLRGNLCDLSQATSRHTKNTQKLLQRTVFLVGNMTQTTERPRRPVVNGDKDHGPNKRSQLMINVLNNIDCVPSNVQFSHQEALLCVFEDNEAVIKMIIKGRSPTMRHVSRTHRVALDWPFGRINLDPKIETRYIDTKHELAEILTTRTLTRESETVFLVCSTSAISSLSAALRISAWWAALKRCRKGYRSKREKKQLWQNRNLQRRTCLLMFLQVPHPRKIWLHPRVRVYSQLRGNLKAGWKEIQNPTQRRVLKHDCKIHNLVV